MLPKTGFLHDAAPRLMELLGTLARETRLAAGSALFEQGDAGDALYAVIEGTLEIAVTAEDGRCFALTRFGPGDVFGEIALFDPGPRTASASALTDATLLEIRHAALAEAVGADPGAAAELLRLAGMRMRAMSRQIGEQAFLPLPARLARRILALAGPSGPDGTPDRLAISQARLADYAGATREAVAKILSEWRRAGLLDSARGSLTLKDRAALEALAGREMF
jgi:CRP-like cAMP-binding protein